MIKRRLFLKTALGISTEVIYASCIVFVGFLIAFLISLIK